VSQLKMTSKIGFLLVFLLNRIGGMSIDGHFVVDLSRSYGANKIKYGFVSPEG
jgi:hypothetical protein